MKNAVSRVLLIILCTSLASTQTIQCKESSWPFWLGLGAVCLGGAAIASSFIEEDPEIIVNRTEITYVNESNYYQSTIESYSRPYGATHEDVMKNNFHALKKSSSSLSLLNRCLHDLDAATRTIQKRIQKVTHEYNTYNEQQYYEQLQRKVQQLRSMISNLIQSIEPLACDYEFITLEQAYNDLYYKYEPKEHLSSQIRKQYWHEVYPFISYKKDLDTGIHKTETFSSKFNALQQTVTGLHQNHAQWSNYMSDRISYYINHSYSLLNALRDMHAWVCSSPEYLQEQHAKEHKEWERKQERKINQLRNKIDDLERQQEYCGEYPTFRFEVHG